jgi:hypothetical protein
MEAGLQEESANGKHLKAQSRRRTRSGTPPVYSVNGRLEQLSKKAYLQTVICTSATVGK